MALALKKKKEESTNEKIVRLFQEGKTVEEICVLVESKNDIVSNVIRRRLGDDALPETLIVAKPKGIAPGLEVVHDTNEEEVDLDGLSKLERYMLEKKKRQSEEPAALTPEKKDGRTISLVDDYKQTINEAASPTMEGISLVSSMPEVSMPSVDETAGDMDGISTVGITLDDIAAPEVTTEVAVEVEPVKQETAKAVGESFVDSAEDKASKAVNKMKAFAMSQIENNNEKISELEKKITELGNEYSPKIETAGNELTESQKAYEQILSKLDEANNETERVREEHRLAIAKAEGEYRKRLEEIDAAYKKATSDANSNLQTSEDKNRKVIDALDVEKASAKAVLSEKQTAVNELKTKLDAENEAIAAKIKSIKDENTGYEDFLV